MKESNKVIGYCL